MNKYNLIKTTFLNSSGDFVYIHYANTVVVKGITIRICEYETHSWFFSDSEEDFDDIIILGPSII